MKTYLFALICAVSLVTGTLTAQTNADAVEADALHVWHCTAYDSHGHGFSATDVHYDHAYHAAVHSCEHATGQHCHHVDCHQDH